MKLREREETEKPLEENQELSSSVRKHENQMFFISCLTSALSASVHPSLKNPPLFKAYYKPAQKQHFPSALLASSSFPLSAFTSYR